MLRMLLPVTLSFHQVPPLSGVLTLQIFHLVKTQIFCDYVIFRMIFVTLFYLNYKIIQAL